MQWLLQQTRLKIILTFAVPLFVMTGCDGEEEIDLQYGEMHQAAEGLCDLHDVGGDYIRRAIGESGLTENSAEWMNDLADDSIEYEYHDFARNSLEQLSGVMDSEEASQKLRRILGAPMGQKLLGVFKCIPYLGILNDFITMFIGFGQPTCNEADAVRSFVADGIGISHNALKKKIWDNSVLDAIDELNDIANSADQVLHIDRITLNEIQRLDYGLTMEAIASGSTEQFKYNFNHLLNDVYRFQERIESRFGSRWAAVTEATYKQLIELTLALLMSHLSNARGINVDDFWAKHPHKAAEFASSSGVIYYDYLQFIEGITPTVTAIRDKNEHSNALEVDYDCREGACWTVNSISHSDWTVRLHHGTVDVKLYGDNLMSFAKQSEYTLDLVPLLKLLPENERRHVPTYKGTCHYAGLRGVTKTCNFDDDRAWPRAPVEKRGPRGSVRYVFEPTNKYLGMGRDGFWRYVFKNRDVLSKYYEFTDPEVSSMAAELKVMINHTKEEYIELSDTLSEIKADLISCANNDDYESLLSCAYFSDPVMDAIKRVSAEYSSANQSSKLAYNHAIPGGIQAEDYDLGGEGIAYHDSTPGNATDTYRTDDVDLTTTSDVDGGTVVGGVSSGEWLEYTVDTEGGYYDIALRVASDTDHSRSIDVFLDGIRLGSVGVDYTGGWHSFETLTIEGVYISEGTNRTLRLGFNGDYMNINWVHFVRG